MSVLVVDDAPEARLAALRALEREGFSVQEAVSLQQARERLGDGTPAVIVLDIELPDGSGLDLLREVMAAQAIPVILLSGRAEEIDRVLGLELGAVDYVVKPFYPRELAIRVRRAAQTANTRAERKLAFPGLTIDPTNRKVHVDGREVELTRREFDLLAHLASAPGRVFSRDDLLRDVWRSSAEWQNPKTVTEHVRRLRGKVEADPEHPRRIVTVSNTGYRFSG
jgi:two-component system, OmpR family, phosphate regulon response regulator PhoB